MKMEEFIAWIRHISWCGFQIAAGQNFNVKPTDEQWESLLNGVDYALNKPDMTPEQSHESWMQRRLEQGWKLGERIDPLAKTHPNMIPFGQLPEIERKKYSMGIIAHNMALKLWSLVQPGVQITMDNIAEAIQKVREVGYSSEPLTGMPFDRVRWKAFIQRHRDEDNFISSEVILNWLDVAFGNNPQPPPIPDLAYLPGIKDKKVEPMLTVDPGAIAPGPSVEPLKAKRAGREPGVIAYPTKMRKYRCAVFLQHRLSNAPEFDQVLLEVQILHGRREHPVEAAVVVEVHALSESQARDTTMDLFRSLLTMKQIGETGRGK